MTAQPSIPPRFTLDFSEIENTPASLEPTPVKAEIESDPDAVAEPVVEIPEVEHRSQGEPDPAPVAEPAPIEEPEPEVETPMSTQPNPVVGPVFTEGRKVPDLERLCNMLQQALLAAAASDEIAANLKGRLYGQDGNLDGSAQQPTDGGAVVPRLLALAEMLREQSLRTHSNLIEVSRLC